MEFIFYFYHFKLNFSEQVLVGFSIFSVRFFNSTGIFWLSFNGAMDSVDCERNTKCEKDEEVDYFGVENGDGPCHKSADFLLISHLKRVQR